VLPTVNCENFIFAMCYGFFIINFSEGVVVSAIKKSTPFSAIIKSTLGELPEPGSTGRPNMAFEVPNIDDMLCYNKAIISEAVVPAAFTLLTLIGIKEALPTFFNTTGFAAEVSTETSPAEPTYNKKELGLGLP